MRPPKTMLEASCVEERIAEARKGSHVALNHLLGECLPYLQVVARRALGPALQSRIDASDLVQETLIEASRDIPHFHGRSRKDLLAWLRQILHNNLANERRRHLDTARRSIHCEVSLSEMALHRLQDVSQSDGASPSERAQARERSETMERALRKLPEHYRQVLLLRTWDDLTFAQIGVRLRCSAEAARKIWGRAAEELVLVLGDAFHPHGKEEE